ncbi:O-antigen ligase family protein [Tenacibaculum jejuense]|uniref:Probable polysaccharide polymerase n=1 Tax=Tenacibaculum jejuense TaxID=584609 RepID=A0A238UBX5_9FLAO|nr:O-antigen ligase family protein [Tenacibaculum jejuense]SNR16486.1 Probable polysaccharide polymerase [Tenacibaculum jejuense]
MKDKYTEENIKLISKIILILYLLVPLSPLVVPLEYEAFQWLWISIVNVIAIIFLYYKRDYFNFFTFSKSFRNFLVLSVSFFFFSCLSVVKSISIVDSIANLGRLVNIFTAIFSLFIIVRTDPKSYFALVSQTVTILLIFFSSKTIFYFFEHFSDPRTIKLYQGFAFVHNFGNINIYTAWTVISLPFAYFLFLFSGRIWKYLGAFGVFLSYLALFLSGSRTALLSLFLITLILVFFSVKQYFKLKHKQWVINTFIIILIPIFSIFLTLNTNRLDSRKMNSISSITMFYPDNYKSAELILRKNKEIENHNIVLPTKEKDDFLVSIVKKFGSGRYEIWRSALNTFIENPFLGVGYGNYQIYSKGDYTQRKKFRGNSTPRRVHNDFLEKFVETGILGGTLYLLLFLYLIFLLFKQLKKEDPINVPVLLILVLISLAYFLDASLNFPLERATIQVIFIILAVFILVLTDRNKVHKTEQTPSSVFHVLSIVLIGMLSLFSLFSNYKNYQTFKEYVLIKADLEENNVLGSKKAKKKYGEIENILGGYPVKKKLANFYLSTYAFNEGNYQKSIDILDQLKNENIDFHNINKLKAQTFLIGIKNLDSAKFYSEDVFKNYPSFHGNYEILKSIHIANKDTVNFLNTMCKYIYHTTGDVEEWVKYANIKNDKGRNLNQAIQVLDTALAYNEDNIYNKYKLIEAKKKLLDYNKVIAHIKKEKINKLYQDIVNLYKVQKFKESKVLLNQLLKIKSDDHFALLYMGIVEMQLKNYKVAISFLSEVIEKNVFKDGKPEFCRGYCYEQIGEIENSKKDYKSSREKKFPQALNLPKSKYE